MRRILMAAVGAVGCLVSAATTAHAQNRFYRCQSTNSGQQWQREWEWFNLDGTASFHTFYFAPTGSFPFVPGDSDLTKQTGYYNYGDVTALGDYTQSDTAVYYHNTRFGVTCYGTPAGNGYYDIHQDYDPVSGTLEVKEYAFDDDCPASDDAGADRQGPFDPESAGLCVSMIAQVHPAAGMPRMTRVAVEAAGTGLVRPSIVRGWSTLTNGAISSRPT